MLAAKETEMRVVVLAGLALVASQAASAAPTRYDPPEGPPRIKGPPPNAPGRAFYAHPCFAHVTFGEEGKATDAQPVEDDACVERWPSLEASVASWSIPASQDSHEYFVAYGANTDDGLYYEVVRDFDPRLLVALHYPAAAKGETFDEEQQTCQVKGWVDTRGRVGDFKVEECAPPFAEAARKNVAKARYETVTLGGRLASWPIFIEVRFVKK